jgi:hypothetical protein
VLCWIDYLRFIAPRRSPVVRAVIIGVLLYGLAVLPLLISGQGAFALHLPVILGAIGTAWSLAFYWIGSQNYRHYLDSLKTALDSTEERAYKRIKRIHLKKLGRNRYYFIPSLLLWLLGVVLVTAEMYDALPPNSPSFFKLFPPEWKSPDLSFYRLATIYIFGWAVVLLVWTLGRLMILHTLFMTHVSRLEYVPSQLICYLYIRPLIRVNILAAASWSIGVGLFGLLFRTGYSPLRIVILGILGMVATIAFFPPIWRLEKKLAELRLQRVNMLVSAARVKLNLVSQDPNHWSDVSLLEEQLTKQMTDPTSAAGLGRYAVYLLSSFVIPIVTAVLGTLITNLFTPKPGQ